MSLADFSTILESIEKEQFIWRKESQLFNFIQTLFQDIEQSSKLELSIIESKIVRYLLQELRNHSSNQLIISSWYTFLSRRSAKVVDNILSSIPTNLLKRQCLYDLIFTLIYNDFNEGKQQKHLLINFFKKFDDKFKNAENICPLLKVWTDKKIKNLLVDELRKKLVMDTIGRTHLGLAVRSSKKRVQEALIFAGYSEELLNEYLLIYQCFKEVHNALNLAITQWKNEQFQQVIERYTQLQPNSVLDVEKLKEILEQKIGSSIRQFLDCQIPSNIENNQICEENGEVLNIIENLPDQSDQFKQERQWIKIIIDNYIAELSERDRQLLKLYYRKNMGQEQIAQISSVNQATVSRKLDKLNTEIFSRAFNLIQNNSLNSISSKSPSSEQLKAIKEYLKNYYDYLNEE